MSTLETAIVFSCVLLVISGLIILPAELCVKASADADDAVTDIMEEGADVNPEELNTFLSGISDNYRIIYGALLGEVSDEDE